jgi:hypothetical protein
MKAIRLILFGFIILPVFFPGKLNSQACYSWSVPVPVSDSISDNLNVSVVSLYYNYDSFYLFWERHSEASGNEILCKNYYEPGETLTVIASTNYSLTNPQVIATSYWGPHYDTLAYIFYQSNQAGNENLYYIIMTSDGFLGPMPFATEPEDETHLRVSQGGGMIWQEGDRIKYSRLSQTSPPYSFLAPQTIDSGDCRKPDIQRTSAYDPEQIIAWEKGTGDNKAIWHCDWSWALWEWSPPILLIDDERYSNPTFGKAMYWLSYFDIIAADYIDSIGLYHYAAYDHFAQEEYISEFSQSNSFQPDLFLMDIPTDDFWGFGYVAVSREEPGGTPDIFSNDSYFYPWTDNTCRIDSTPQPDRHPQLVQGQEGGDCFDLICVWESYRNGHWQLVTSTTLVIIGGIGENDHADDFNISLYPNPFNDCLRIGYFLKDAALVNILIIDTYGRIVKNFDIGIQEVGRHEEMISIPEISSGTYLVKVASNGISGSKVILKH